MAGRHDRVWQAQSGSARPTHLRESRLPSRLLAHAVACARDLADVFARVLEDDGERGRPRDGSAGIGGMTQGPLQLEMPPRRAWGPCHNLYAAVLVNAVNAYRAGGPHRGYREAAFLWFAGFGEAPLTFRTVCEALRLDPVAVRRAVLGRPAPVLVLLKQRRKKGGGWLYGPRAPRHVNPPRTRTLRPPHRMGRARYAAG